MKCSCHSKEHASYQSLATSMSTTSELRKKGEHAKTPHITVTNIFRTDLSLGAELLPVTNIIKTHAKPTSGHSKYAR